MVIEILFDKFTKLNLLKITKLNLLIREISREKKFVKLSKKKLSKAIK